MLPSIISEYEPYNIFNADETGLYWRAIPDGTLALKQSETVGCKMPKKRLALLLSCNMDGSDKLEPQAIGKSRNPLCFRNIKQMPVEYKSNKNAWMTTTLWIKWLKKIDNQMRKQCQIVMLCDNCAAHSDDIRLMNIKLVFLPPNTTSLMQPMDQGIIANFKRHYRSLVLRHLMTVIDASTDSNTQAAELARKLTVLDSLHMIREAWSRVTPATISNYRRVRFISASASDQITEACSTSNGNIHNQDSAEDSSIEPPVGISLQEFALCVAADSGLPTSADSSDMDICTSIQDIASNHDLDEDDNTAAVST